MATNDAPVLRQNVRWGEEYVSRGLNVKLAGVIKPGVYHGFVLKPGGTMAVLVDHEPDYPRSVAVVERDGYSLTVVMDDPGRVYIPATGTWFVCIEAHYSPTQQGYQRIVVRESPEPHHVILGKVIVEEGFTQGEAVVITWDMISTDGIYKPNRGIASSLAPGGGLAVGEDGKLHVVSSDFLQLGGGLSKDADGNIFVDFSAMPTDKFEKMLKSIRVPVWLSAPLNIYVNQQTGSDTLDEGRGLSESKPFQTLMAALLYVSTTYNLYIYNVIVHIAQGYASNDEIYLPSYTTTTGRIIISGPDQDHPEYVKLGLVLLNKAVTYLVRHLTILPKNSQIFYQGARADAGVLSLQNVVIDVSSTVVDSGSLYVVYTRGGTIEIPATSSADEKNGLLVKVSNNTSASSICILAVASGSIIFSSDIQIDGSCSVNSTALASLAGAITRNKSNAANPGRFPNVTATGTLTGYRYRAITNGIIDSHSGGPDFFPGTVAGITGTGGQYA